MYFFRRECNIRSRRILIKSFFLILILATGFSAYADVVTIKVCDIHKVSTEGRHCIAVKNSQILSSGVYELFATNQFASNLLSSLYREKSYCVIASINPARAQEGLALISVK